MNDVAAYALLFLLTLAPGFEGRYSIALAVAMKLDLLTSLAIIFSGIALLAAALSTAVSYLDTALNGLAKGESFVSPIARRIVKKVHELRFKVGKSVNRWGVLGLVAFVAIPLPLTGMWTGALVGYLLGLDRSRLALSLALGGALSVLIVFASSILVSRLSAGMP